MAVKVGVLRRLRPDSKLYLCPNPLSMREKRLPKPCPISAALSKGFDLAKLRKSKKSFIFE